MQEKQELELEMRELLIMINNNELETNQLRKEAGKTTLQVTTNNEELASRLKKQIHRRRAEYKLDNRQLGTHVEPLTRLRALRDQMGDIENMARELEMTDFETYTDPVEEPQVVEIQSSSDEYDSESKPSEDIQEEEEEEEEEIIVPPLPFDGPKRAVRDDDLVHQMAMEER